MIFDWQDLAYKSKSPIKALQASFIAAPRDISGARLKQLLKELLPQGNVVIGLAKEAYINGFEGQPQFKTLQQTSVTTIIAAVNRQLKDRQISLLRYRQAELEYILDKNLFKRVVFVNGSWKYSFHLTKPFFTLVAKRTPYQLVSAFIDETEAKAFVKKNRQRIITATSPLVEIGDEAAMLQNAAAAAARSYEYSYQTGVVLAQKVGGKYKLLAAAHNTVVPFETYAMVHGNSREKNMSPANDLNHYDAVHAETQLMLDCLASKVDLKGTSVFINLMPCPNCSRTLVNTPIKELIYSLDHSDGYAIRLFEAAGKSVRRIVLPE